MKIYSVLFSILSLILCPLFLSGQIEKNLPGSIIWEKDYGGNKGDVFYSGMQNRKGDLTMVGSTRSFSYGGRDAYIVILDQAGEKVHENHFGGSKNEEVYAVAQALDGSYLMVGYSESEMDGCSGGEMHRFGKRMTMGISYG